MRLGALLMASLLLAGCSGSDAPSGQVDEVGWDDGGPGDTDGRSSVDGGGERDNTTRVWEHVVTWDLESAPAGTTLQMPGNLSDVVVLVHNIATAPCGANVGEPPLGVLAPSATFTSPSGAATQVDLFANECSAGGLRLYSGIGATALEHEPGEWKVSFSGRGTGLQQRLVVEAETGAGNTTAEAPSPGGNATWAR